MKAALDIIIIKTNIDSRDICSDGDMERDTYVGAHGTENIDSNCHCKYDDLLESLEESHF